MKREKREREEGRGRKRIREGTNKDKEDYKWVAWGGMVKEQRAMKINECKRGQASLRKYV